MQKPLRLALVLPALLVAAPAARAAPPTILVKFERPSTAAAKVEALGDEAVGETATRVAIVKVPSGWSASARVAAYEQRADVVFAEPNRMVYTLALGPPNDANFLSQWGFAAAAVTAGWAIYPGAYGATGGAPLAVVDTGVAASHPDLAGQVRTDLGARCLSLNPCYGDPASDDEGHGTHVAGIAAAATNNGVGVAGVAFSSPVIPVKVLDSSGIGYDSDVANGIIWAAQHGARVINLSLGGDYSQTDCDAVDTAEHTYGALVVAAAGNDATSTAQSPAGCPGAVGVAATTSSDTAAPFSNVGAPDVFVAAPGTNILSTYPSPPYVSLYGTSMASPFVAGLAALRFGQYPASTPAEVRTVLASTSDKIGGATYGSDPYGTCAGCTWSDAFGYGRVNVARALAVEGPAGAGPPAPLPPPPASPPPPPPPPPSPPPSILLPPDAPAVDTTAPIVRTYSARGQRGRVLKLSYSVRDDRHRTAERIWVYRGTRLLKTFVRALRETDDSVAYWIAWRAPRRRMLGRFCVRATNTAGLASATSCARVVVR